MANQRNRGNHFAFYRCKGKGRVTCVVGIPPGDNGFSGNIHDSVDNRHGTALINHNIAGLVMILLPDDQQITHRQRRFHTAGKHHRYTDSKRHGEGIAGQMGGIQRKYIYTDHHSQQAKNKIPDNGDFQNFFHIPALCDQFTGSS